MLHDTGDNNILTVANRINFSLNALKVLINKDRMILSISVDDVHELLYLFIGKSNLHALSAKYVRRSYKYGITKAICNFFCFLSSINRSTLCTLDLSLFKNLIEDLSVFCGIYVLSIRSVDLYAHLHKILSKLNGCLSAKLNNRSVGFLKSYDILNILGCKRLEIKLIGNIKVGTYSLGVVIYDNCLKSGSLKCPCCVNRAIVELDTLSDSDRT